MSELKQQIEKRKAKLLQGNRYDLARADELSHFEGLLADYVWIPRKQLEELCKKYGEEPHVKRTSAYKAIRELLEDSK